MSSLACMFQRPFKQHDGLPYIDLTTLVPFLLSLSDIAFKASVEAYNSDQQSQSVCSAKRVGQVSHIPKGNSNLFTRCPHHYDHSCVESLSWELLPTSTMHSMEIYISGTLILSIGRPHFLARNTTYGFLIPQFARSWSLPDFFDL